MERRGAASPMGIIAPEPTRFDRHIPLFGALRWALSAGLSSRNVGSTATIGVADGPVLGPSGAIQSRCPYVS